MTTPFLPGDVARCQGDSLTRLDDGVIYWHPECFRCLRRTAPTDDRYGVWMTPPPFTAPVHRSCDYRIAPEP